MTTLSIGDVVKPVAGHQIRSGGMGYAAAVVCSIEPFILVSPSSDMMWSAQKADDFDFHCKASPKMLNGCMRRLEPEQQRRVDEGESLMSNKLGCGLTLYIVDPMIIGCVAIDLEKKSSTYQWLFSRHADGYWQPYVKATQETLDAAVLNAARFQVLQTDGSFFQAFARQ